MTYSMEVKNTKEAQTLIAHLKTLKYLKLKEERKILTGAEIVKAVKAAEKSKSIPLAEAIKRSEQWKNKFTK